MSWSRTYTGTPQDVARQFRSDRSVIEAPLPEFEKGDIAHVVKAAEQALNAIPNDAKVSLSVSGHGFRDTTGGGGGAVAVSVNYSLVAEGQPTGPVSW